MGEPRMYGRDLVDAIMERDERKVKRLMRKGANTNFVIKGDTAIHLAARYGLYKSLKYMLEEGEDVNKDNAHGNTALHYAAREGREDIVKLLMDNGATPNRQNHEGETPLHGCVGYQPMDVIERFIQMGMDVNTQTNAGDTPLHRAVEYSREESVEALLLCKADPYRKNMSGKRPDQMAKVPSIGEQIRTHGLFSAAMDSGYIKSQGMKLTHRDVRRPLTIDRVGIVIEEMDIPSDFPTSFYCRREKAENTTMDLNKNGDEIIVSDVFILRVRDVYRDVDTKLTLPIYAKPSDKEDLHLKFPVGGSGKIDGDVFDKDQELFCIVTFTLVPETTRALYLCVSPKAETLDVGTEETTIESEVDPGFSLQVPEGAFKENTALSLKVFETIEESGGGETEEDSDDEAVKAKPNLDLNDTVGSDTNIQESEIVQNGIHKESDNGDNENKDTEDTKDNTDNDINAKSPDIENGLPEDEGVDNGVLKKKKKKREKRKRKKAKKEDPMLLSDVYEIKLTGEQPSKGLQMQIPLKHGANGDEELQIVRIDSDEEQTIQVLSADVTVTDNGFAVFEASHFSMYVIIPPSVMRGPNPLENVKQHVKDTKARKQEARFFVMLRQLDTEDEHGRHVLLVECIRSGASGRRRSRWKKQGYEKQKPKNSKKLKLAPGQEFYIQLTGEAIFDTATGETGTRKITFSPHRASYQPYNIRLPPMYQTGRGCVHIVPIKAEGNDEENGAVRQGEVDKENEQEEAVAKLKIQLNLPPPEEPFSEYLETLAYHKTFAEIRAEEERKRQIAIEKARKQKQIRELQREQTLTQIQTEIQEKGLPNRPQTAKEANRFKPGALNIDV